LPKEYADGYYVEIHSKSKATAYVDDPELAKFLISNLDPAGQTINLDRILGIGGESIVIKYGKQHRAAKYVPFNKEVTGILGYLDPQFLNVNEQSAENIPVKLDHPNIISYHENLFKDIDTKLFHITIMDIYDITLQAWGFFESI